MKFNPIYLNLYSASTSQANLLRLLYLCEHGGPFGFRGEDLGFRGEKIRAFLGRIRVLVGKDSKFAEGFGLS